MKFYAHENLLVMYTFCFIHSGVKENCYQAFPQCIKINCKSNINKIKFKPHGDLVDRAYLQFNETLINNQDPYSQIENDETSEAEYLNENDSEDTETNKTSTIPTFMPQILPAGEITKGVNSLNSKQSKVFNVVHKWTKDYVKCNGHNVELVYIFLSGSGGTGKSHLVKVIYNAISKTLLYHFKDPEKPRVLLLGPTGISAVNMVEPPSIQVLVLNQE